MDKHVTIANVMDWVLSPWQHDSYIPMSNKLILENLADAIADLLNGTYTIAQLRNAILNDKKEIG